MGSRDHIKQSVTEKPNDQEKHKTMAKADRKLVRDEI